MAPFQKQNAIWLDNKFRKDLMPSKVLSKFCDDPMKYVHVRKGTKVNVDFFY